MPQGLGTAAAPEAGPDQPRSSWKLQSTGEEFVVIRRCDLNRGESFRPVLSWELSHWLADPFNQAALYQMYADVYGRWPTEDGSVFPSELDQHVKTAVEEAFLRGRLLVLWTPPGWSIIPGPNEAANQAPATAGPQKRTQKTWIEVQLVNRKGKPVPGARYRLKITDGSVREGTTDENGSVRVAGIDPGTCEVSFPDFDAKEWTPA